MRKVMTRFHTTTGPDIFSRIIRGEIPCKKRFEDDFCLAFDDLNPVAPIHILVVPKLHTRGISNVFGTKPEDDTEMALPFATSDARTQHHSDAEIVGRLFAAAAHIAESIGLDASGYRMVINNGEDAGQTVHHLHLHLIGGRQMAWPPG